MIPPFSYQNPVFPPPVNPFTAMAVQKDTSSIVPLNLDNEGNLLVALAAGSQSEVSNVRIIGGTSGGQPVVVAGDIGIPGGVTATLAQGSGGAGAVTIIGTVPVSTPAGSPIAAYALATLSGLGSLSVANIGSGSQTFAAAANRRYLFVHNPGTLNIGLSLRTGATASAAVGVPGTMTILPNGAFSMENSFIYNGEFTVCGTSGLSPVTIMQGLANTP